KSMNAQVKAGFQHRPQSFPEKQWHPCSCCGILKGFASPENGVPRETPPRSGPAHRQPHARPGQIRACPRRTDARSHPYSRENLVVLALKKQVTAVLLTGDVYDGTWRDFNTGLFFTGQMARLQESDIPVFMIPGNHDAENKMTMELSLPGNVHRFHSDVSPRHGR